MTSTSTGTIAGFFKPLSIRGLTVKNRVAMSPMNRNAAPDGVVGEDIAQYYRRRVDGEVGLIGVFVALDLFLFYIFWEVVLVPMYLIIGIWGGSNRIYATIKFVLYTLVGSLLMLVAILATAFMALSLTLALMNRGTMGTSRSLLDTPGSPATTLPAPPAVPSAPSAPSN